MFSSYDQIVQNFHKGFNVNPQAATEDPTYMGFKFIFDFNPSHRDPLDMTTHDPLFADIGNGNGLDSAEQYLSDIGFTSKSNMIRAFKENLRDINANTPYYFQSIEGVGDLWKIDKGEGFNSFRGKDKVLVVNCLESIDLRITSLADLYRKATFDAVGMRELLPQNLRYFTVVLQIAEMRSFHRIKKALDVPTSATGDNNGNTNGTPFTTPRDTELEIVQDLISIIQFKLEFCEFDFDESWPSEDISHADMQMAKQKFKIKVGRIRESNLYTQLKSFDGMVTIADSSGHVDRSNINFIGAPKSGDLQSQSSSSNELGSAYNNISRYGQLSTVINGRVSDLQKRLERAPGDLVARGTGAIQSRLAAVVLGNVYDDLKNQSLGNIINGFVNKPDQVTQTAGGNVYPTNPPAPEKLGREDVFPTVPEVPKVFPNNIGNVFGK